MDRSVLVGLSVLLCMVQLTGCASLIRPNYTQAINELRAGDYSLDPEHAYVHFKVEHLGLSTVIGRFNAVDATLDFNPASFNEMKLDGVIDVASIDMNNEDLEVRLQGSEWFNTGRFPEARFQTRSVTLGQDNEFVLSGDFSLRGVTRSLSLNAVFKGGADNLLTGKYTIGFAATGSFLRSDYGVDALAALVSDEVFVEIHAEFQKNN